MNAEDVAADYAVALGDTVVLDIGADRTVEGVIVTATPSVVVISHSPTDTTNRTVVSWRHIRTIRTIRTAGQSVHPAYT